MKFSARKVKTALLIYHDEGAIIVQGICQLQYY